MKYAFFAAIAVLGIVLGSLTLASPAHAVYFGADHTGWVDAPNG